jgi:hypothetical protein
MRCCGELIRNVQLFVAAAQWREIPEGDPMSDDLHARLHAAITARLEVARAADVKQGDPEWYVSEVLASGGEHFTVRSRQDNRPIARVQRLTDILDGAAAAAHIALHDPADAIRRYERDLRVLERHTHRSSTTSNAVDGVGQPHPGVCNWCEPGRRHWPCVDIRDLLDAYPEVTR